MKYCLIFISFLLIYCKSLTNTPTQAESQKSAASNNPTDSISLSESKKNFILDSTRVEYFEVPGFSEISNPEELQTFSVPVKNLSHIDKFKTLTTNKNTNYSRKPIGSCKPTFNSALVFHNYDKKETILFSLDCGLLYLYQEKLYTDVSEQRMDIENTFRLIRSGR